MTSASCRPILSASYSRLCPGPPNTETWVRWVNFQILWKPWEYTSEGIVWDYLFWVGLGMLGGIVRRLAATGRVVLGSLLSACKCPSSWEDEDDVEDGWTLASAVLTASESINVIAKIAAVNDLLQNTMVVFFFWLRGRLLAWWCMSEWVLVLSVWVCVKDRNRGKKRFHRLFLNWYSQ